MGITCIIECVHVGIYYDCPFMCTSITYIVECVHIDKIYYDCPFTSTGSTCMVKCVDVELHVFLVLHKSLCIYCNTHHIMIIICCS